MSIAIIKIKDEEMSVFRKIVMAFTGAKIRVLTDADDYEETLISELVDEGKDSGAVEESDISEDFKQYGVDL